MLYLRFLVLFVVAILFQGRAYADVYPFEEDYSAAPAAVPKAPAKVMVSEEPSFQVRQEEVTQSERLQAQHQIDEENRTDRFLSYRQITFQNAGQIFLNFWNGLAVEYKDIFTRALPEYGSDLVSIPGGTVEVVGKFAEIERKELFERAAKEKDIQAYVEAQEKPLTPEEKKALDELRGKPISGK